MKHFVLWLIGAGLLLAAGLGVWSYFRKPDPVDPHIFPARVKAIKQMVELCTLEINEEMCLKDSINGKWLIAKEKIRGSVRFDIDRIAISQRGDTLVVKLPPERVVILESDDADAYRVLDTWDGRNFFPRRLTAREENIIKGRWRKRIIDRMYDKGHVSHARRNAVATLSSLISQLKGNIVVIDTMPSGLLPSARAY